MSLATEGNTDLAFDTTVLRDYGNRYGQIATDLRNMSTKLNNCLSELKDSGWTTPAGSAFQKMAETNWEDNIDKYADLLDTLKDILFQASKQYDNLAINYIEKTKL
ncbi:MAG: WXG100 family type VII secretion target [Clostridia bacterium]|nr:WXG100 family type VII secretion target [Clostridia bacterium]